MIEPTWLGSIKPHQVICKNGHEVSPKPNTIQQGGGICRTCVGQDPAAAERKFRESVVRHGGRVVEPTWLGSDTPHRVVCAAGHASAPLPSNVRRQGICRVCVGRDPATAERAFRNRVAALGGQVLEPVWLGVNGPHRVRCREGHESWPWPSRVRDGGGICRTCAGQDPEMLDRSFRDLVAARGGQVLEGKWLGSHAPHRIICEKGHAARQRPHSLQQGRGLCRFCAGKSWDVFYIVTDDSLGRVKFGITSNDARRRLRYHRRAGYLTVVTTIGAMADAAEMERAILATLRLAGITPVQGREYYDIAALPVILDIVDNWVSTAA